MNPISLSTNTLNPYSAYGYANASSATRPASPHNAQDSMGIQGGKGIDDTEKAGRECQTCKERKYQDGSDEMVSFKAASHISPQAAPTAVRAHEQEHVSNAYQKAEMGGGEVIRASVTIHTSVCPECGRSYVSGGTTETQIKYSNEQNPYQQMKKASDGLKFIGMNLDVAV